MTTRWQTLSLAGLVGSAFAAQLGGNGLNVALPQLASSFGAAPIAVQGVVIVYFTAVTVGLLIVGPLGDRAGRRRVLLGGLAVFGVASVLGVYAPTLPVLLAARAVQGFGGAAMAAMSVALVMDIFAAARIGATLGVLSTTSALATMLGPSIGGVLISSFSWRSLFAVNVLLVLVSAALVAGAPPDAPSGKQSARVFDLALLRIPTLTSGLIMTSIVAMVMTTTLILGPFILTRGMGLSLATTGFVLAIGPLVSVVLAVSAGRLADRIGARRTTIGALTILTAGAALVALVVERHNVYIYVASIVCLSIGYATFQTPNSSALMSAAPVERRATVSGLMNLARNIGFIIGTASMGALYAATNASTAFAATAGLALVALGIGLRYGRQVPHLESPVQLENAR